MSLSPHPGNNASPGDGSSRAYATPMAKIVTYVHRPKRARKPARKPQGSGEPVPTTVTARKTSKARRPPEASDAASDTPVSDSLREFFERMIRPPNG